MIEEDFYRLKHHQSQMEKKALLIEGAAIGGSLLGMNLLTNFIAPNATISALKNTETGQNVMSSFFETGIKHGQQGLTLKPAFEQALTASMNKDIFKDYYYGKEIGKALGHRRKARNDQRMKEMYQDMKTRFGKDPETLKELRFTPVLGSFYRYMNNEQSKKVSSLLNKMSVKETKSPMQNAESIGTRVITEGAFMALDPVSIMTRPLAVAAHEQASKQEPTDSGVVSRATGSVFMSPRVYDKQELKSFLEKHTHQKRVIKKYLDLPRTIQSLENKKAP